jgi:hypothetical protein
LFVVGVAGLLAIMRLGGMDARLAVALLLLVLVRCLVMARIRAQTGVPQVYLHGAEPSHMVWLLGGALLAATPIGAVPALVLMSFLATATYLAPHHADALKLADRSGLGVGRWSLLAVFAVAVGLVLANLTHLTAFYHHGALNVNVVWNLQNLENHASDFIIPTKLQQPVDRLKVAMAGTGFLTTSVLYYLRRFYWFPLHPAGYVVACAIGYRVFAPVLLIWFIKWSIVRYFGGKTFRKAKDYFLGIVLGQFGLAIIWSILGLLEWEPTLRFKFAFW